MFGVRRTGYSAGDMSVFTGEVANACLFYAYVPCGCVCVWDSPALYCGMTFDTLNKDKTKLTLPLIAKSVIIVTLTAFASIDKLCPSTIYIYYSHIQWHMDVFDGSSTCQNKLLIVDLSSNRSKCSQYRRAFLSNCISLLPRQSLSN